MITTNASSDKIRAAAANWQSLGYTSVSPRTVIDNMADAVKGRGPATRGKPGEAPPPKAESNNAYLARKATERATDEHRDLTPSEIAESEEIRKALITRLGAVIESKAMPADSDAPRRRKPRGYSGVQGESNKTAKVAPETTIQPPTQPDTPTEE